MVYFFYYNVPKYHGISKYILKAPNDALITNDVTAATYWIGKMQIQDGHSLNNKGLDSENNYLSPLLKSFLLYFFTICLRVNSSGIFANLTGKCMQLTSQTIGPHWNLPNQFLSQVIKPNFITYYRF